MKKCSSPRSAAGASSVSLDNYKNGDINRFLMTISNIMDPFLLTMPVDHPVSLQGVNERLLIIRDGFPGSNFSVLAQYAPHNIKVVMLDTHKEDDK